MFNKAIQEYIKEQDSVVDEIEDVQFIDSTFETLGEEDLNALLNYPNIEFLNLANVGLKNISASFPSHEKIGAVILSNNRLSDDVIATLTNLKNLESLALDGNQITSIDSFKILSDLSNLREIALADCPIASETDYRSKLFEILPQLQLVDGHDKDGQEIMDDSDEVDEDDIEDDQDDDDDSDMDSVDLQDFYAKNLGEDEDDEDEDEEDDDDEDDDDDEEEEEEEEEEDDDDDEDDEEEEDESDYKRARHE